MQAHTQSTVTVNESGHELKTVTVTDYLTHDNVGTITITSNQMNSTGLGYSIDTVLNVKTYVDNALIDNTDIPFSASAPVPSNTSSYVRNSSDSITITGALGVPDPSGNIPTGDTGAKLAWSGDTPGKNKLWLYSNHNAGRYNGNYNGLGRRCHEIKKH